jgi:hypothetical protein
MMAMTTVSALAETVFSGMSWLGRYVASRAWRRWAAACSF